MVVMRVGWGGWRAETLFAPVEMATPYPATPSTPSVLFTNGCSLPVAVAIRLSPHLLLSILFKPEWRREVSTLKWVSSSGRKGEKREREGMRENGERGFAAPLHCEFPLVSASIMQSSKKRRKRREEIKGKKRGKKRTLGFESEMLSADFRLAYGTGLHLLRSVLCPRAF